MQSNVNLEDAKATPKADEWDNMTVDELKTKTLWTQGKGNRKKSVHYIIQSLKDIYIK